MKGAILGGEEIHVVVPRHTHTHTMTYKDLRDLHTHVDIYMSTCVCRSTIYRLPAI